MNAGIDPVNEEPEYWMRERIDRGVYKNKIEVPGKMSGGDSKEIFQQRRQETRALKEKFQLDLERAFLSEKFQERKKLDLLFKLAWDHGHSAGFTEVLIYYEEMVPLLK